MSATLEHLDNYRTALRYLLSVTEKFCLLRTFLAETTRKDDVHQVGAPASYPVYEFSSDELRQIFSEEGFDIETGTDRYTGSQPKDISSDLVEANIVRTQFVIMARRRAK